jgi:ATP-dependent protease ClpP protease subunit
MKEEEYEDCGLETSEMSQFHSHLAKQVAEHSRWFSLWGEIGDALTEPCGLFLLNALRLGWPMATLFVCSGGGSEDDSRGLIGLIEHVKQQGLIVRAYGAGIVGSAAFDIFIACSKGYRFVHECTLLMTHSSSADTRDKDLVELQDRFDNWTIRKYTHIHPSTREKFLRTGNWWFDPYDAIKYGAVDAVVKNNQPLPTDPVFPKVIDKQQEIADVGENTSERGNNQ